MNGKFDYDKLQDTLEYIKGICEDALACSECPLGSKIGFCKLSICPKEWNPRHPETDVFRVLD